MSGSGPIYEYQRELTARLEQALRERDELRAEVERLRTERSTLLCGEGCSLAGILDGQDGVSRCAEHDKRLQIALRTVAEAQREACADYVRLWRLDPKAGAIAWHSEDAVRATPLVTEGDE